MLVCCAVYAIIVYARELHAVTLPSPVFSCLPFNPSTLQATASGSSPMKDKQAGDATYRAFAPWHAILL